MKDANLMTQEFLAAQHDVSNVALQSLIRLLHKEGNDALKEALVEINETWVKESNKLIENLGL